MTNKSITNYRMMLGAAMLVVALILGGAFFALRQKGESEGDKGGEQVAAPAAGAATDLPRLNLGSQGLALASSAPLPDIAYNRVYSDPQGRFSFSYPESFTVGTIEANGTETLVVQSLKLGVGFQVIIRPFADDPRIVATKEGIEASTPGLRVSDEREANIGGKAEALVFTSTNPAFEGGSREVWFAYKGYFYELNTFLRDSGYLEKVLPTWKF